MVPQFQFLKLDIRDNVAQVTLNRADKMNALNMQLRDEIEHCFDFLDAEKNVHSVVLTGGEDIFSAGFDISEVIETNLESFTHRILEYHLKIYGFSKPVITAVSGFALAGGFDLALCGDVIIASDTAVFGHPEVRFGVNPLLSPLWRKVGVTKAVQIAMTGETFNAEEACRIGLAAKIVPADKLLEEAFQMARRMAKIGSHALAAVKRAGIVVPRLDIQAGLEYEFGLTASIFQGGEMKSKIEAYARKAGLIS